MTSTAPAAVGDPKLTYLGFSYGTYLGATYASLFPYRSRALVLDGALNPQEYTDAPLENLYDQSVAFDVALNRFFAWCDTSPICGFQGGRAAFDKIISDARLPAPAGHRVGRPAARAAAGRAERGRAADVARQLWPLLGDALTLAQQAGDGSLLLLISDAARGRGDDGSYGPGADAFVQTSCVDLNYPTTPEAFEAVGQRAAQDAPLFGLANNGPRPGLAGCAVSGRSSRPPASPVRSRSPPLAPRHWSWGRLFDPATPYKGAQAAHDPAREGRAADDGRRRPHGVRRQQRLHRHGR